VRPATISYSEVHYANDAATKTVGMNSCINASLIVAHDTNYCCIETARVLKKLVVKVTLFITDLKLSSTGEISYNNTHNQSFSIA
jgi:hypothetical protein